MYRSVSNCFFVVLVLNLVRGNGAIFWLSFNLREHVLPPGAVLAGNDVNGDKMYVGRIEYRGNILPGKAIPAKNLCYTSYAGKEITSENCEVLLQDSFSWREASNGRVPSGAVKIGTTPFGETLYFGRKTYNGYTTPGKIYHSLRALYYPFNGREYHTSEYETLVSDNEAHFEVHDYNHF